MENGTGLKEGAKMMRKNAAWSKLAAVCFFWLITALLVTGCSTLQSKDGEMASERTAPARTGAANAPVYYDFGDVMLPRELRIDQSNSFVMKSGGVTSGVLVLRGGVDSASLITFFESKMPADGWTKKGSFRSARSIMLFEKKNRWCVISVAEGKLSTQVEIWVAPTEEKI
jgi:hypothetical protein